MMYRKEKVAVAVDNYKRERDDDSDDDESSDEESSLTSTEETQKKSTTNEIEHVKSANSIPNQDDNNQIAGFNMFLQKMKENSFSGKNNQNMNQQKRVDFDMSILDAKTPSLYTVTSISQGRKLENASGPAFSSVEQTSKEWLGEHGLAKLKLTIENLISKGKLGEPKPDEETGEAINCLIYDELEVTEFEYKIHMAIELYSKRIKWCLQGSRKKFGLVSGHRVGILIDCSDVNLGFGRMISLQDDLLHLLDEQLYNKKSLHIGYIGTDAKFVWESPMDMNCRVLQECKEALGNLCQLGGCNLLQALKQIMRIEVLDRVVLIMGSSQDQDSELLLEFYRQLSLGRNIPLFHCVAYETDNMDLINLLDSIAEISGGTFHRYSAICEELIYSSPNINLLMEEIGNAQGLLSKVALMRKGLFNSKFSPEFKHIMKDMQNLSQSDGLPQSDSFADPLKFEKSTFSTKTSSAWLVESGLKANKLDLFSNKVLEAKLSVMQEGTVGDHKKIKKEILSPVEGETMMGQSSKNSFTTSRVHTYLDRESSTEEVEISQDETKYIEIVTNSILRPDSYDRHGTYVASIGKMVTSNVYEKAMIQVIWPDGTEKNVHADLSRLFEYQKVLGEQVKLMEKRINWLATGSRRLFGTIVETKAVFVLDLSLSNLKYLVHIQHSLKILIQQQLPSLLKFNLVAFNSNIVSFKPGLIQVNEENLVSAWHWIRKLHCSGSRNFIGALRTVLENPVDIDHQDQPQGIYLFTSGVPDQNLEPLINYIEEKLVGTQTRIHTVLFNVDDYDPVSGSPIPSRYANITKTAEVMRMIAHRTGGRFHWFRESGIIESDDIRQLMGEIDLAVEYSRRTQQIIKDYKEKYPNSQVQVTNKDKKDKLSKNAELCRRASVDNMIALPPPRPTSLSKARQQLASIRIEESDKIPKTLAYKSKSGSQLDPMKSVTNTGVLPQVQSAFYVEDRNNKGVVYRDNTNFTNVSNRRGIGKTEISNKEEWISSRDWMKKYSLRNMGLNLLRLVSGPDCRHEETFVIPIAKFAEAKYCAGLFPIVNVKGTRKHLQYTPSELNKYDVEAKKALQRYVKRLEWLIIGSKRIFGVITEPVVVILLDISGSMVSHMAELMLNLKLLVWEQLFKRKISYNLVAFNNQVKRFREEAVVPDEVNCHSAVGWAEHLVAKGNTDTLRALVITLEDPNIQGIYLLSDGKPDNSTDLVLKTIRGALKMREGNHVYIHTISFNCEDETANQFMRDLSRLTDGRYHKVCHEIDVRMFTQRIVKEFHHTVNKPETTDNSTNKAIPLVDDYATTAANILSINPYHPPLPEVQSDDLVRLTKEIQLTRTHLAKTSYFRQVYFEMQRLKAERKKKSEEALRKARLANER